MVFNTTFKTISAILWSVLLEEEIVVPGEHHRPAVKSLKFTLICINMPFLGYSDFKFLNDSCFVILSHSFALDLLHIDDLIVIL
jgi:hypothetical protein